MNSMADNLRSGLAALAEEVHPVDLRDRTLRASRRLAIRRTVVTAVVAGVAVGLTTTVALALPSQQATPPVQPARSPAPSTVAEPTPPERTPPEATPPERTLQASEPVESQAPPGDGEVAAEAMLQASDLGPDYQPADHAMLQRGTLSSLSTLLSNCGYVLGDGDEVQGRTSGFVSPDGVSVHQEAYRFDGHGASQELVRVRDALVREDCQRIEVPGDPAAVSELFVIRSDFTGMGSVLIEEIYDTPDESSGRYHVAIYQGDLFTNVMVDTGSEGVALRIAAAAAQRLCEATPTC